MGRNVNQKDHVTTISIKCHTNIGNKLPTIFTKPTKLGATIRWCVWDGKLIALDAKGVVDSNPREA